MNPILSELDFLSESECFVITHDYFSLVQLFYLSGYARVNV